MRYLFFINPKAGKGKLQKNIKSSIDEYFKENGGDYEIIVTEYKGQATEIAMREAQTGDSIRMFACGGEGTCFEILNGIVGYDNVSLGVIPCGSANDFLKFFSGYEEFYNIPAQIEGECVKTDIIKAGDYYCLNNCSVGMDAMVARDMQLFKRLPLVSGPLAYNLAIVKVFLQKIGITASISVDDGKPQESDCLFAVVANAPYYGGGYKAAPDAKPFDSMLNFTKVDLTSRFKILRFLGKYKKGDIKDLPFCTLSECQRMSFTSEMPIPVNLDGEIFESSDMTFQIVEDGVSFVVPTRIKEKILTNV